MNVVGNAEMPYAEKSAFSVSRSTGYVMPSSSTKAFTSSTLTSLFWGCSCVLGLATPRTTRSPAFSP